MRDRYAIYNGNYWPSEKVKRWMERDRELRQRAESERIRIELEIKNDRLRKEHDDLCDKQHLADRVARLRVMERSNG